MLSLTYTTEKPKSGQWVPLASACPTAFEGFNHSLQSQIGFAEVASACRASHPKHFCLSLRLLLSQHTAMQSPQHPGPQAQPGAPASTSQPLRVTWGSWILGPRGPCNSVPLHYSPGSIAGDLGDSMRPLPTDEPLSLRDLLELDQGQSLGQGRRRTVTPSSLHHLAWC